MRKLNATLLNGTNKEEAILKIKDESFAITTDEQLIKIPYSNVKSYNYDEQKKVLSIVKFGGNPIELNVVKDKQLLELLNNIVEQNKNNNESISNSESTSLKENNAKLKENTTIRNTDYEKIEIKQLKENKKENTKSGGSLSIIIGVFIIGIIFFGAKSLFFDNSSNNDNSNKNKDLSTFEINDTCWTSSNSKSTEVFCFDNKNVYYVKKVDNEFRATKYARDMYDLIKISNTNGKFYNSESSHDYELKKDNDNISLNVTFKVIDETETYAYNLINQKTSTLKFTEPKINLNILGNDITLDYPNLSPMLIFSKLTSNTLTIKDKDGNITNTQGYKFKSYGNKLVYMKENEYLIATKNGASSVLDEHTLCYKINNGTKQTNFMKMSENEDYSLENVTIHYCNSLD